MSKHRSGAIKRILVALDDSSKAIGLLHAAVELAETLDAELLGLFVEDVDLLTAAELPFFREINMITRTQRKVERKQIERTLLNRAHGLRSEAERILEESKISWRFTTTRGTVSDEIRKAAANVDLLVMARSTMSDKRLGSTARRLTRMVPANLMLIEPAKGSYVNLLTIYDGSEKALQAMDTAAQLAEAQGALLTIAIASDAIETAKKMQLEASKWLREHGINARFRWILPPGSKQLAEIVASEGACMVVLPDKSSILQQEKVNELLAQLNCPVFLIG